VVGRGEGLGVLRLSMSQMPYLRAAKAVLAPSTGIEPVMLVSLLGGPTKSLSCERSGGQLADLSIYTTREGSLPT